MNTQNRNAFAPEALPLTARQQPAGLHHPFFDSSGAPSEFDCLNAIDRSTRVIELLNHLSPDNAPEGLSSRAASGYWWLSVMLRDTLKYTRSRLTTLSRKRRKKEQRQARYLSALSTSLATLGSDDRDHVLNAMASRLQVTRSDVDVFIDRAIADNAS